MVSSPILWSGRYGCEKNQKFSWTLRIPYPGVSPPDTRLIILLIPGRCSLTCQALSHTLHRWSAVGELRVSDQRCLACTAGGRGGRKLLPPKSEGQHSPVRQRLRPRTA